MQHRVVQSIDPLEIFGIEHVLRADTLGRFRTEIGAEQLQHRPEDRQAGQTEILAALFELLHQIRLEQRVEHDAGRLLDLRQHPIELFAVRTSGYICSTGETCAYCAATARATVTSVSPVASEIRCKWK